MAQYTQLTSQQIHQLAQQYNLSVNTYAPIDGGAANTNILLDTPDGLFVLTIGDDRPYADSVILASLLDHLAVYNFPTSQLVPAANGEKIISFEDKPVMLKHYIRGETLFTIPDEGLFALGQALAQLHAVPAPDFQPKEFGYGRTYFHNAYGQGFDPAYEKWLKERQDELEKRLPTDLPRSTIHGDVFWDNIIFQDGEFQALIDFEDSCHYYSAYDLGSAISGTCEVDGILDLRRGVKIVAGYQEIRKLQPDEKAALKLFTIYAVVSISYWRYLKYNLHNPIEEKKYFHRIKMDLAEHIKAIPDEEFNRILNIQDVE